MKLHFLATGNAPTAYSFDGDTITAKKNGQSEQFDLSGLQRGGKFLGVEVENLPLAPGHIIRNAYRDSVGELHVTLCQAVGANDWAKQDGEIDAAQYNPSTCYVQLIGVKQPGYYEPQWNEKHKCWNAVKKETSNGKG